MLWVGVRHVVVMVMAGLQRINVGCYNLPLSCKNKYVCMYTAGALIAYSGCGGFLVHQIQSTMGPSQKNISIISGLFLLSGNDNLFLFTSLLFGVVCVCILFSKLK